MMSQSLLFCAGEGDYSPLAASVTFSSTQTLDCVNITVLRDTVVENVESLTVVASSTDSSVNLITNETVVQITDSSSKLANNVTCLRKRFGYTG